MTRILPLLLCLVAAACAAPPEELAWTPDGPPRSEIAEAGEPVLQLYDVRDLVPPDGTTDGTTEGGAAALEAILADLRANVAPETWSDGDATAQNSTLIVRQRPAVHRQIAAHLDTLRRAALAAR